MATKLKIPKGAMVSADTVKLLSSAGYLARVAKRKAIVAASTVGTGYYPDDGNVKFMVVGFRYRPGSLCPVDRRFLLWQSVVLADNS